MFEVGVESQFQSAHSLRGPFGPATQLHGHTYRVQLRIRGEALDDHGMLVDISLVEAALDSTVKELDFHNLNEIGSLREQNTTAEVMARFIHEQVTQTICRTSSAWGDKSMTVTVWESPQAFASYGETR